MSLIPVILCGSAGARLWPVVVDLVMIEVQSGESLVEDDIVRYQDIYGRA
jgi:mannose-1-phosphate guanylyltransferase